MNNHKVVKIQGVHHTTYSLNRWKLLELLEMYKDTHTTKSYLFAGCLAKFHLVSLFLLTCNFDVYGSEYNFKLSSQMNWTCIYSKRWPMGAHDSEPIGGQYFHLQNTALWLVILAIKVRVSKGDVSVPCRHLKRQHPIFSKIRFGHLVANISITKGPAEKPTTNLEKRK